MSDQIQKVILVDENDRPLGVSEKLAAHQKGLCHRAFSIFLFRGLLAPDRVEDMTLLLQRRSDQKYHSPGLWSNTCCSHPAPGEDLLVSAQNRLMIEMGFSTPLHLLGSFHYRVEFPNGLIEDEVDHLVVGFTQMEDFNFNPEEVSEVKWMTLGDLQAALDEQPESFTFWLKPALTCLWADLKACYG